MKKITKYMADDGTIFDTEQEAVKYENIAHMRDWYDENRLYSCDWEGYIEWGGFIEWCREHKDNIQGILNCL